ncbi:MAG TPA: hypothetical protein VGE41_06190 [Verrucomicrobiae bacterium]|jgi:hypothetical protein
MKTHFILLATLLALAPQARSQEDAKPSKNGLAQTPKQTPSQEELEATFKSTLNRATMKGRWCMIKDGELGTDRDEKYSITSVSKLGDDTWLVHARIQYGKKDITAPIPVQVKWAGDTPVIIVDKVEVPGGGTYSARVLIYEKTYAGTWSGGDHGGLLHGTITNEKE